MRKFITTTVAHSALCLAGAAMATETAKPYPAYLCKTASEPIRYDAVMLVDHAENPKLRGVVTLEDLTSLPANITALGNGPWRTYDGLVVTGKSGATDTMWVDGSERTVALAHSSHGMVLIKNRVGGEMTISTCMSPK